MFSSFFRPIIFSYNEKLIAQQKGGIMITMLAVTLAFILLAVFVVVVVGCVSAMPGLASVIMLILLDVGVYHLIKLWKNR